MSRVIRGRRIGGIARQASAAVLLLAASASRAFAAGMPQLDFRNPLTTWQVAWGALIFLILYLLLSRSALPRVESVLNERRSRIEGDLDAAKAARREADQAVEALRRARREAAAEAGAIVDKVVAEARTAAAARNAEMNQRLEAQIQAAEADVASARQSALAALPAVATDTAQVLVERLLGRAPDRAPVANAVDATLAAHRAA